ncbi:MAG: hypothetical protein R3E86_21810 [Pseudomonadales bacterium]
MFSKRPALFLLIVLLTIAGGLAYHLRTEGIFACDGSVYGDRRYLAYCNSVAFLNYDQGAFWYRLEEEAYQNAVRAEVLFVGNSKTEFALSTEETDRWFSDHSISYFLFGFAHNETVVFFEPILKAMQPHARAIIVHVDQMFEDRETPPMQIIHDDPAAERIFRTKRLWQPVHRSFCTAFPAACGQHFGLHRDTTNGQWLFSGTEGRLDEPVQVGVGEAIERDRWAGRQHRAERFVQSLPVDRSCVILTLIPSLNTRVDEAESLAAFLNMPLISPRVQGLTSFDRNHLDERSASIWSTAFLNAAGPRIERCVKGVH